jgi:phosphatidyl-myo-inositol dimannoside synthase
VSHVLVTNDFPPKVGGIQSYLWELWRRLPAGRATVLTTRHPDAPGFDSWQPMPVSRLDPVLLPRRSLVRAVNAEVARTGATLAVLDPALPLGLIGPHLDVPYAVVLHGAEITVPRRLPGPAAALRRVLAGASLLIAAGPYPAAEARRVCGDATPPIVLVPPGVDTHRFRPIAPGEVERTRHDFGLPTSGRLVLGLSRLVPRKGFDTLIRALSTLVPTRPDVVLAIAGRGRDEARLRRIADDSGVPTHFLGRVEEADLPRIYASADVFAMLCRDRWMGLEQEGFGIVFLEAAACGVASVAGDGGGAADAVQDGVTGLVVPARQPVAAAAALADLLDDRSRAQSLGEAGRRRAETAFDYDRLAQDLDRALAEAEAGRAR